MRLTSSYDLRHPVVMAWARFIAGAWLLFLIALLFSIGDWWAAALLVPAVLLFWVGWRVLRGTQS